MRLLFASDSFKGSLSSSEIHRILTETAERILPTWETDSVLTADGGEGTLEAVLSETGGELVLATVEDPLRRSVQAAYGRLSADSAIVEMSRASGLTLLTEQERDPLRASTYGTGQLILHALEHGARRITVAIGGSATNDGGMGAMSALGIRFYDEVGRLLRGSGEELERVRSVDRSGLDPRAAEAEFTVMCDVTNPLVGPRGATRIYGPQKGATPAMIERLEEGMRCYAAALEAATGEKASELVGGGAAGGLGASLMLLLGAKQRSGIDAVLDLLDFDRRLRQADLVITGEGRMDGQSSQGKVACGVGRRCQRAGVPVVALVGSMGDGSEEIYACGIESILTAVNAPMPLSEAMERAEELYRGAAERLLRMIRAGAFVYQGKDKK